MNQKTTKKHYWDMLEVLPPAYYYRKDDITAFQVGEASDHKDGFPTYASYVQRGENEYYELDTMTTKALSDLLTNPEALTEALDNAETPEALAQYEELCESHSKEAVDAYIKLGIELNDELDNFEEAYTGEYDSDEAFAQDQAEQLGLLDKKLAWPHKCIDWEYASKELMYDYSEQDGFYFRNL